MARGNKLHTYWKDKDILVKAVIEACENYAHSATRTNAAELINNLNALRAAEGWDISGLFDNFPEIAQIIAKAEGQVGRVIGELSPETFRDAFSSFETLRAYGLRTKTFFSRLFPEEI